MARNSVIIEQLLGAVSTSGKYSDLLGLEIQVYVTTTFPLQTKYYEWTHDGRLPQETGAPKEIQPSTTPRQIGTQREGMDLLSGICKRYEYKRKPCNVLRLYFVCSNFYKHIHVRHPNRQYVTQVTIK